mmetsp:Transcript_15924/g.28954  ORF Transcript_15924/g.28954 Transcript_15924/m.28954 type:complete len:83 (-) Transcript_15924:619-867(-)
MVGGGVPTISHSPGVDLQNSNPLYITLWPRLCRECVALFISRNLYLDGICGPLGAISSSLLSLGGRFGPDPSRKPCVPRSSE